MERTQTFNLRFNSLFTASKMHLSREKRQPYHPTDPQPRLMYNKAWNHTRELTENLWCFSSFSPRCIYHNPSRGNVCSRDGRSKMRTVHHILISALVCVSAQLTPMCTGIFKRTAIGPPEGRGARDAGLDVRFLCAFWLHMRANHRAAAWRWVTGVWFVTAGLTWM